MLDIKFIRNNPEIIREAVRKKHLTFEVKDLLTADQERVKLTGEIDELRQKQNEASEHIAKETDPNFRSKVISQMKELKDRLQKKEAELKEVMKTWQILMLEVPNVPDMSVPEGADETANQEIRKWGEPPKFSFPPKSHIELMNELKLADLEGGTKIAGFRGYVLKNAGVTLSFALWRFALDELIKKDFSPILVPSRVKRELLVGTGYLPHGEDDLFKTQDGDYLAGTGEVGAMGYFMDEVVPAENLPIKLAAFSPCFRREAGSHGKDTKGLMRVHEFFKVEQLVIGEASHEASVQWHEALTKNAEEILQALELPYRVVVLCGGDLGKPQVKTYDIETWLPSEGRFRETHSSSYYHDFQTRRLNIRYRSAEGKLAFAHSLNNTAIATPRILAALVENNQQADGSIKVPKALAPYLGQAVIK